VLWPLVPAMAMVMIDFTIVSISVTTIQRDLRLSATAAQWLVTAYALSTAAFIALGGRLGDIFGHKRLVATGIILFAVSSAICGFTPDTSAAEPFMIAFRVLQGIGGALLIPSATVLVLNSFPAEERGKGPRGVLHRRRPVHRRRSDRRVLSDAVLDLASHLLDQCPGGAAVAD
jgi:MFS family permease